MTYYLSGAYTKVHTDHKPLVAMSTGECTQSQKIRRWFHKISELRHDMLYVKGNLNILADGVPRLSILNIYHKNDDTPYLNKDPVVLQVETSPVEANTMKSQPEKVALLKDLDQLIHQLEPHQFRNLQNKDKFISGLRQNKKMKVVEDSDGIL